MDLPTKIQNLGNFISKLYHDHSKFELHFEETCSDSPKYEIIYAKKEDFTVILIAMSTLKNDITEKHYKSKGYGFDIYKPKEFLEALNEDSLEIFTKCQNKYVKNLTEEFDESNGNFILFDSRVKFVLKDKYTDTWETNNWYILFEKPYEFTIFSKDDSKRGVFKIKMSKKEEKKEEAAEEEAAEEEAAEEEAAEEKEEKEEKAAEEEKEEKEEKEEEIEKEISTLTSKELIEVTKPIKNIISNIKHIPDSLKKQYYMELNKCMKIQKDKYLDLANK